MSGDSPRVRLGVLGIVAVSLFCALFARLYYLQVLAAPEFEQAAERNRARVVQLNPTRGRILDRDGRVLADNRLSTVVTVDRKVIASSSARAALFEDIAPILGTTPEALEDRYHDGRYDQLLPLPLAEDVPPEVVVQVDEQVERFPGVEVADVPVRIYPYGTLAAHVLGYVGRLPESEAQERLRQGYQLGDTIGIAGVERIFEADLRGTPGWSKLEVDASNRVLREVERQDPVPGHDVQLTIDAEIQQLAEQALQAGLEAARQRRPREGGPRYEAPAGSVVVTEPSTGAVLAMASYPAYDPQQFSDGISQADYDALTADDTSNPLINRAIQGEYAPGSTFKLVTAVAGVETGVVTPSVPINDTGTYKIPGCRGDITGCTRSNAGGTALGRVDLPKALAASSDVYFYGIGADLWRFREERGWQLPLQEVAARFGFGRQTGITLPAERAGRVPTPELKQRLHDEAPEVFPYGEWFTGDNVNTAIGQGDVLATPLQLVNAYSTLANGGTVYQPNIVWRVLEAGTGGGGGRAVPPAPVVVREIQPRVQSTVELPDELRGPIVQGLVDATSAPYGTAAAAFAGSDVPMAGKTGTAQKGSRLASEETSLFVAFGPATAPQYTVGVVMEEAGFGSSAAAPVARVIVDGLSGASEVPRLVPSQQRQALDVDLDVGPTARD